MSQTPDPRHPRRRRTGGWLMAVGVLALFLSTFTVPEAIHLIARVSAGEAEGLNGRGLVVTVVGAVTLLGGGALAIAGFNWRRSAGEAPSPEDRLLDEQFGDGPVLPYDPDRFRGPGDRDPDARD
ncbi:hypothetical protein [uncultured Kocuria sp.]|uniref:hypothetical protein n=1 Tax=uncultured Kocuria sp. TaxID=259305 RepID=UPI00260EF4D7|nr:hypothetical protein [uncultured Kocuria sp.]